MRRLMLIVVLCLEVVPAQATDMRAIVQDHILPGYKALSKEAADLAYHAEHDCAPQGEDLVAAYHKTFDAWIRVSHLRFGPSEEKNRAFALAFWPDPRGATPKALSQLIQDEDPAVFVRSEFQTVSVAARGLYALEFLLFDPQFAKATASDYTCDLVQAITRGMLHDINEVNHAWETHYGDLMMTPGNETYRTAEEAARQVFTALTTGLEFTSNMRLGRPLGTFERPRPRRAEAWRSGRSLRHVLLSLEATRALAAQISERDRNVDAAFAAAIARAHALNDPVFAGVAEPQSRLKVEVLQQSVDVIRAILAEEIGPSLGIAAGFNALDGD